MTPTRRNNNNYKKEDDENTSYFDELEPYKLPAGLLNLSFLDTIDSEPATFQSSQLSLNRAQQRITREDITKRRRPRLTYSRWNMMISSRYKTELCRQYDEEGICQFEDKCLFAHGRNEIRPLPRHPKYKTELCRDFHETGFCSFGPRCNFIHTSDKNTPLKTTMSIPASPTTVTQDHSLSTSLHKLVENCPISNLNAEAAEWRSVSPPFGGILGNYVTNGQYGAIGECSSDTMDSKSSSDTLDDVGVNGHLFQHLDFF